MKSVPSKRKRARKARKDPTAPLVPRIPLSPFAPTMTTWLSWSPPAAQILVGAGGTTQIVNFSVTDLNVPDSDAKFGSAQPFYYDTLVGPNGPYKYWHVKEWRVKAEILNMTTSTHAVELGMVCGALAKAEIDSFTELISFPGNQRRLCALGAPSLPEIFYHSGRTTDYQPDNEADFGAYGVSPAAPLFAAVGASVLDGTISVLNLAVKLTVEYHVRFTGWDGVAS
jgi:hypothetical protein